MKVNNTYYAIGLMSGSSLDGLDICYVRFHKNNTAFEYEIIFADCIEYTIDFRDRLRNAPNLTAFEFAKLHTDLGKYFGQLTNDFILKNKIDELDFICSHGQTIFHQPNIGFTTQIGCGAQIAAQTNTKVICDLRTNDVANAGQGAPIVPIAEQYLFSNYKVFLNIGGIANIAFHNNNKIIAYDICAANTMLNFFAKQKNIEYDNNGDLAKSGNIIPALLEELNKIDFCKQAAPKSLGTEHIIKSWLSLFERYENTIEDKLATAVEHIAIQVAQSIKYQISSHTTEMLITGGGALNVFLIDRIQHHSSIKVKVPDTLTVQYKEALAMAFIGLLRILEIPNCLASVTGAKKDVIGGAIYLP
jgi:anhydro-N-acetylmuramic acid kinase